jgi:ribA/ribD-fused uncharacterized protein
MSEPIDVEALIASWRAGARPSCFFFWGHRARRDGKIGKWCLSQWWPAAFVVDGVDYPTAEHFMMAGKARLFGDADSIARILANPDPSEAKKSGRKVRGFDEEAWNSHRYQLVVQGNVAKFLQHPALASLLLSIREDVLVEASPVDTVWGIGLAENHPDARNPERWRGLNLLGFALTEVRARLRSASDSAVQQPEAPDEAGLRTEPRR